MTTRPRSAGFTLTELAIVLAIVGFLTGGLLMSLSAQQENRKISDTQQQLNQIVDALLGYAAANGRLPCPAAPGATGVEAPLNGGTCSNPWNGFLPAVTLGIAPTDSNGYALDSWGNPIRYGVTTAPGGACGSTYCFATANGIKSVWATGTPPTADLRVCNTASGLSGSGASADCAANTTLSSNAVAVIYSRGKNGGIAPASADETANGNADRLYVSHSPTSSSAASGEFDDLVVWLSPNILFNRMIAAGRLP